MSNDIGGVWRTVGGRRVFIKDGEDLESAMKNSGKFRSKEEKARLSKVGKEARDNLKELELDKYEDGTYNIESKKAENFTKGYQATFQQLNDKYSDEEFGALVEKYKKIGDGNVYAGKFGGSPEVSFYFEKEEDAIAICKQFNQVSYWDWENMDEVKNKYYKKGAGNDYE